MNNVLKAMAMNSHLKIASVLVLSIGSLAVGFVAGNRGIPFSLKKNKYDVGLAKKKSSLK